MKHALDEGISIELLEGYEKNNPNATTHISLPLCRIVEMARDHENLGAVLLQTATTNIRDLMEHEAAKARSR